MLSSYLAALVCVLCWALYRRVRSGYRYWESRGVRGPPPALLIGNFRTLLTKEDSMFSLAKKFYNEFPDEKVVGIYQGLTPTLVLRDPDLIKRVLIKDFSTFMNRAIAVTNEPLTKHLFSALNDEWKVMRQKLSPVFTSGKLKQMMPILSGCLREYEQYLDQLLQRPGPVEVRGVTMKYTLKGITSVAFGLDINTFDDEDNEFIKMALKIFEPNYKTKIVTLLQNIDTNIVSILGIKTVAPELERFFFRLVNDIIREREGKPKVRKDFMDFMIELKEAGHVTRTGDGAVSELEVTEATLLAQALLFYAAGFETSAGSVSFLMYELAMHPDKQERCYQEIREVMDRCGGKLSYDDIADLKYVSMAFEEAMRKHPVVGALLRQCSRPYEFEDIKLKIDPGTKIMIPSHALQMDPKYFPNPENFEPERFAPENRDQIRDCTYLPFGDGPRNCIGMRFAKLQSLLGIAHFLYKVRVEPCERTPKKIIYDPNQIMLNSKDGIWLTLHKR